MRQLLIIVLGAALLNGCARGNSDSLCNRLIRYSPEIQIEATIEIDRNAAPILSRFAEDYGELRAVIRANCP